MKANCKFCEEYQRNHWCDEILDESYRNDGSPRRYREYTVALVRRIWTKEQGKRCAGTGTSYKWRGIGYDLNFCPECGKRLKGANDE